MKRRIAILAAFMVACVALAQSPSSPSEAAVDSMIQQTRDLALHYTDNLPNFICTQTVKRYKFDPGKLMWKALDLLTLDLTFSDKGETYRLLTIDGKPTKKEFSEVGGIKSSGEFGTLLYWVFRPESHTKFQWKWQAQLRGHEVDVFAFQVEKEHSAYHVGFDGKGFDGIFAWSGLIYIDRATHQVQRVRHGPDAFPSDWPSTSISSELDYDFLDIGGDRFLVPLRAEMRLLLRNGDQSRNEIMFRDYRKFSSQSTIRAVQ